MFKYKDNQPQSPLIEIVQSYLLYLFIFLIFKTVKLRQIIIDQIIDTPEYVFENVTREDAEKDFTQLLKFLINYGFYKFGYEVS